MKFGCSGHGTAVWHQRIHGFFSPRARLLGTSSSALYGSRMVSHISHPQEDADYGRFKRWMDYLCAQGQSPTADDFSISMREAFALAEKQVPTIVVQRDLVGGNPCIKGTRIPVYMILDAIEYYGSLKGVLSSYPQLTIDQVKDAVRFSKIAMECYVAP